MREQLTGYLFIAPAVLLIGVFGVFPLAYALYMSLYTWRVRQGGFVGLRHYATILGDGLGALWFFGGLTLLGCAYALGRRVSSQARFWTGWLVVAGLLLAGGTSLILGWGRMATTGDVKFLNAVPVTLYYAVGSIPLQLAIALVLAYVLFQNLRGTSLFRTIFFLPYVMPTVATATVFRTLFSPRDSSMANQVLNLLGLDGQKWLAESQPLLNILLGWLWPGDWGGPSLALVSIIIFGIWTFAGYNVVIFLAGLSTIAPVLYEAGRVDGGTRWQLFRHITLPLISPITFYLALINFIGALKAFNHIFVMRTPLAGDTVNTASVVIFDTFYNAHKYGYAAAQVVLLFLMILGVTYTQSRIFGERVTYD